MAPHDDVCAAGANQWHFESSQRGMSATLYHPSIAIAAAARQLRFGSESQDGEPSVQWLLKRNCSSVPRQMLVFVASLCALLVGVGAMFWLRGGALVRPFAWFELLSLGAAALLYVRHATDRESIRLQPGRLTVEHASGSRVERVEFAPAWVRVEPRHGDRSLVEISGQGRRILVGRFVRPELRRQLAEELRWALRRWQGMQGPGQSGRPL